MAVVILPNIRPIIRIAIVSLTLTDTIITANKTITLPKLAAIINPHFDVKNEETAIPVKVLPNINKATPSVAPELMPNTNGPANGFLNKVCIINPETPSPLPTIIAVKAFGNRYSITICLHDSFSTEAPIKLLKVSNQGIKTEPKLILAIKHSNSRAIIPMNTFLYDLFGVN